MNIDFAFEMIKIVFTSAFLFIKGIIESIPSFMQIKDSIESVSFKNLLCTSLGIPSFISAIISFFINNYKK